MTEAERILGVLGLVHGPLQRWCGCDLFTVYYGEVELFEYKLWCYVQIWKEHPPDVWLFLGPIHTEHTIFSYSRGFLYDSSVYGWANYENTTNGLTKEVLTEAMLRRCVCG